MLGLQDQINNLVRRVAALEDDCNCTECNETTPTAFASITLDVRIDGTLTVPADLLWNIDLETSPGVYETQFQSPTLANGSASTLPVILLPIGSNYSVYLNPTTVLAFGYTIVSVNDALNQAEVTGDTTVLVTVEEDQGEIS